MATVATVLQQTVEAEVSAVRRFVSLLEREQEMLAKGEVDQLLDLVSDKSVLAAQLATLADQRGNLLTAEGLTADRAGFLAWCAGHSGDDAARKLCSSLLSLASRARELNRVNGELIQLRMQHNTLALEALMGASGTLALYGPDGQSTPASGGRISDSA